MPALAAATRQTRTMPITRVRGVEAHATEDQVSAEEPLEIRLAYTLRGESRLQRLAVTMRTPGHDAELAVGFLVSEGAVRAPQDIFAVESAPLQGGQTDPNIVVVRLAEHTTFDVGRLERHVYTTSSCGVCGKASLEAVGVAGAPVLPPGPTLTAATIHALPRTLRAAQAVFEQTGGLHAAALFTPRGALVRVREDVGRHNALDKLVGSFFLDGRTVPPAHLLFVSGRASFELAQKALMAGISVLAAVGAPSSLAVDLADEFGMTLLGFVRDDRFNVYAGAERLTL
ncbi:MAG: formate dehydrogenase accessory sulfurtransferase FdhD [Rhodothermaceae bacterium]|nr:formate dehydrogenase accessory sulfurtransferase FdhD [Rhodothermaceae bacterium]